MTEIENPNTYKTQLVKWSCIGLLIRLMLMPFTMHTLDLIIINYFPYKMITAGAWDPYTSLKMVLPNFAYQYYPPMTLILFGFFQLILKLFGLVFIGTFLEKGIQLAQVGGDTFYYATNLQNYNLFANLLVLKIPYLIFDFAAAALILKLASDRKDKLTPYKLWMLNPIVLHSCFAIGQFDIVPAFFLILGAYLVLKKRYYPAVFSLIAGGAMKMVPFFPIPALIVLIGQRFREKAKMVLFILLCLSVIYVPFYLSARGEFLRSFFLARYGNAGLKGIVFNCLLMAGYAMVLYTAWRLSKRKEPQNYVIPLFMVSLLVFFAFIPVSFRHLVFLAPFLALWFFKDRITTLLISILVISLAVIRLYGNELQWGLFAPINPDFFSNIPSLESFWERYVPVLLVHRILYRVFICTCLLLAYRIWRKDLHAEK